MFGRGTLTFLNPANRKILAYLRDLDRGDGSHETILCCANLSRFAQPVSLDLSAYAGQPLSRDVLHAAAGTIMADITGLLARMREESPPASPYDPAAARRAARQEKAKKGTMPNDFAGEPGEPTVAGEPSQHGAGGLDTPGTDPAPDGGGDEPRKAMPA